MSVGLAHFPAVIRMFGGRGKHNTPPRTFTRSGTAPPVAWRSTASRRQNETSSPFLPFTSPARWCTTCREEDRSLEHPPFGVLGSRLPVCRRPASRFIRWSQKKRQDDTFLQVFVPRSGSYEQSYEQETTVGQKCNDSCADCYCLPIKFRAPYLAQNHSLTVINSN